MADMRRRPFTTRGGKTLGFTELGLGGAPLGNLYAAIDEGVARETIEAAWDVGCRVFDTAPFYGLGLSEARFNLALRGRPRDSYVLSTKVGRLIRAAPPGEESRPAQFIDHPRRKVVFDYSYDGVMRSVEDSLERLGADRFDMLFCHDIDAETHGSAAVAEEHLKTFMDGGYRALERLRAEGSIAAFGAGLNEWRLSERMARAGDFDVFLLAGRYTLLEQGALATFLPLCAERGVGVLIGGPYNSGILVLGAKPGATWNYEAAPPDVVERVRRLERVCAAHSVALPEAALRFPLGHPSVAAVIPGARSPAEVRQNAAWLEKDIPDSLWSDLRAEGLLDPAAPLPTRERTSPAGP